MTNEKKEEQTKEKSLSDLQENELKDEELDKVDGGSNTPKQIPKYVPLV